MMLYIISNNKHGLVVNVPDFSRRKPAYLPDSGRRGLAFFRHNGLPADTAQSRKFPARNDRNRIGRSIEIETCVFYL